MQPPVRAHFTAAIALLVLTCLPASAQLAVERLSTGSPGRAAAEAATVACSGGIVYDDGSFESGMRFTIGAPVDAVMRFDLPGAGNQLDQVCVCWFRGASAPATLDHQLVVFAADGPSGSPGTELLATPFTISSLPVNPSRAFYSYDLSSLGVTSPTAQVYVGARWNGRQGAESNGIYLCLDDNGPGHQPQYAKESSGNDWQSFDDLFVGASGPPPHAIGVRVDVSDAIQTCPTTACVADATTLCLNDNRFKVTTHFATDQGTSGEGQAVELNDTGTAGGDTGYFWFFKDTNVEVVVKALNACGVNSRYWVFAGGLTDVQVEMTVCDTLHGLQRTYSNPQSTPFKPIQATDAFATCP